MPAPHRRRAIALFIALVTTAAAAQERPPKANLKRPLVIASQGSFFVGGDTNRYPRRAQGQALMRQRTGSGLRLTGSR